MRRKVCWAFFLMSTEFIGNDIWSSIRTEAKQYQGKSFVAVAYFGTGASKRLPLKKGSILVVDATDKAVKSGQTNPSELKKLQDKGVRIFSSPNLHAKVFVFGEVAFVGSTNVSENSEDVYSEASIRCEQISVVSQARQFVRSLAINEMGPSRLEKLVKVYNSRKRSGAGPKKKKKQIGPRFFVVRLTEDEEDEDDREEIDAGKEIAKKLISSTRTHEVNYFWNRSKSNNYRSGDAVLQVMLNDFGKILYIIPPAEYLYTSRNQKTRYYFFEQLRRPEMSPTEFRKKLPASLRKRIDRSGKVSHEVEIELRKAFSK